MKRKDSAYSSAGASGETSCSDESAATAPIARDFAKIRIARDHVKSPRKLEGRATASAERTVMISAHANNKEHTSYWRRIKVMALSATHTSHGGKG